jgi:RNA polymerase sigma-70 factor (ECF subfamily)
MGMESEPFLATRRSLITRLKNWDEQEGWREFFQMYWTLIYSVAVKSGLSDTEAEAVVQETVVSVARALEGYRYDPEQCRFKTWLMGITRRRIVD